MFYFFAQVLQVRKKDTNRIYAMKILKKSHIIERDEVEHTKSERAILAKNNACPFLVGLKVQNSTSRHCAPPHVLWSFVMRLI
jgi:serum/glucocorticoid-regulated kinase 2